MRRIVLPTFLLCGVQRGGTTFLYRILDQHPSIGMSKKKEIHFFTRDQNYMKGLGWYAQFFIPIQHCIHRGEATPHYYRSEKARQRIRKDIPAIKCLFILRDPVERSYSHYWHHIRSGVVYGDTFLGAIDKHFAYINNSLYAKHLLPWFEQFSHEQLCVILYDDLRRDADAALRKVWDFLDVEPISVALTDRVNEGESPRFFLFSKTIHAAYARASRIVPTAVRDFLKKKIKPIFYQRGYPPLDPEIRRMLIDKYFRDDILKLQDLLKKDLTHWLK